MLGRKLGVALVVGAGVLGAGCNDDSTGPGRASVDEQVAYIDGIVPHHQIALMRADEALAKAVHPGLKAIAQRMKEDQGREISEFQAYRQQIANSAETPAPMMPQPIPAGAAFDSLWMTGMMNHHQGAVDMSTLALGSGVPYPLDSLARHTIEEQRMEQEEFQDSLRVWYGTP